MAEFTLKAKKDGLNVTDPIDEGDSFDLVLELVDGEIGDIVGIDKVGFDIDGERASDESGYSVSMSDDGTRVAIGAPDNSAFPGNFNNNNDNVGHVRIYEYREFTSDDVGEYHHTSRIQDANASPPSQPLIITESTTTPPVVGESYWMQLGSDIDGGINDDEEWSGYSVSLSGDGRRVAIGAPNEEKDVDDETTSQGLTRIYEYDENNNQWIQLGLSIRGETFVTDELGSGYSVSLSTDGSIIAIGAPYNDDNTSSIRGHVRLFEYAVFTQRDEDEEKYVYKTHTQKIGGSFGNPDSKPIIITSVFPGESSPAPVVGDFYWKQLGSDIDGEANGDRSGWSVSLSGDGTRVAIGARRNDGNSGTDSGHTRIYEYREFMSDDVGEYHHTSRIQDVTQPLPLIITESTTTPPVVGENYWMQLGKDIDGERVDDDSGYSVSLSGNGTRVAIGAPFNDDNGIVSGHVRIYEYRENVEQWVKVGLDIDGEAASDRSGWSVSLSGDGTRVAIGAYDNDSTRGHTRIYDWNGSSWVQVGQDIDGERSDDRSGWSVSLSGDGTRVAIGAPYNDDNGTLSGHTRIYEINQLTAEQPFTVSGTGITDFTIDGQQSLSGVFNIDENTNLATKAITISSDFVDESPQESITFTLDKFPDVSVTIDINDIRKQATLEILNGITSIDEGSTISFEITPNEGFDPGETINISYNDTDQFESIVTSVTTNLEDPTTALQFSLTPKEDRITEGNQNITVGIGTSNLELGSKVTFTINDTSLTPKIDTFTNDPDSPDSYNEGDTVTLNLTGINLVDGDRIPFTITNEEDFDSPIPTDFVVSDNTASVTLTISKDDVLEFSNKTVTATLEDTLTDSEGNSFDLHDESISTTSFVINPSTVTLEKSADQLNERASPNSIDITINTTFIQPGTEIPFVLSDPTQFIDPPTKFVVEGSFETGRHAVTLVAKDDRTTEGNQTITLTLTEFFPDKFISFDIIDDSQDATITLTREPNSFSINEGDSIDFILTTDGLPEGTEFTWKIDKDIDNSVSAEDIDGDLEGTFTISLDSPVTEALDGSDSVTITTIADPDNTGNKFIQFNVFDSEDNQVASTQVLVFDTSPIRSESIRVNSSVGTNGCTFMVFTQGSTAYSEGDIINLEYKVLDSNGITIPAQEVIIDRTEYDHSPLGQLHANNLGYAYAVLGSDRKAKNYFHVRENVNDRFGEIKIELKVLNNV